jgi:hypothetical protein
VGDGQGWFWEGDRLACGGTVLGVNHSFNGNIAALHGPGTYPLSSASYSRDVCNGEGCALEEGYAPGSADGLDCTLELTTAPAERTYGAMVSGTFHCGKLFEDPGGARSVTVYDGLIATTIEPLPD